jgi:outer membrane protein OmpA-like peptidoglycan-associated protein
VYDSETSKPLEAAFELIDLATGKTINQAHSDPVNGSFLLCIPANKNYALNVNKTGYLFYSDNFSLKGIHSNINPFIKNIPLNRIKQGETAILKNIFFITDSYELLPESQIELNKLIEFLIKNPTVKIEIGGHTDNTGTEEYNLKLSNNRAKAVNDYLIAHNIDPFRINFKGYGESKPVSDNNTEEGKALNRRTEFMITAF